MRYFFKFFLLFLALSCTSMDKGSLSHIAVFPYPYSLVWSATLLVLKDYPIEIENKGSGQIQTKMVHGYKVWKPPQESIRNIQSRFYNLEVLLEKGTNPDGDKFTRVNVIKNEFEDQDFIRQNIPMRSNGLEENLILYRIQRELFLMDEQKKYKERQKTRNQEKSFESENEF